MGHPVSVMLYFVSDPESESESIRSPESEPESKSDQPHHDSAPLASAILCSNYETFRWMVFLHFFGLSSLV